LEWPIKNLWCELKLKVHKLSLTNLLELEQYCQKESYCQKLISGYRKRLKAVIVAKGATTKY
jgi:hypothetical protein